MDVSSLGSGQTAAGAGVRVTGVPNAGVGMVVGVTVVVGVQEGEGLLVGVSLTGCV